MPNGLHTLAQTQRLKVTLAEGWAFVSDPRNLSLITPPDLGFQIEGNPPEAIFPGCRIAYTVKPLFGIGMSWETLIEAVEPPHRFVDTQARGPYAFWRHEHRLVAIEGGVEMQDEVTYKLPLHPLSAWAHPILVKPRLASIFAYRREVLRKRFGEV
jgi:ligand-binding SRPBCC domain-containing protein